MSATVAKTLRRSRIGRSPSQGLALGVRSHRSAGGNTNSQDDGERGTLHQSLSSATKEGRTQPAECGWRGYGHVARREDNRINADHAPCQTPQPDGDRTILPIEFPHGEGWGHWACAHAGWTRQCVGSRRGKRPALDKCSPITVSSFRCGDDS
jgi:hypothetical protein